MKLEDHLAAVALALLHLPITGDRLRAVEGAMVDAAMSLANGNRSEAAKLLGVHRKTVERRLAARGTVELHPGPATTRAARRRR